MEEITLTASVDQIKKVVEFVNDFLKKADCSERSRIQIDVAIDEIFGNIALYAYEPDTGPVTVRVDTEDDSSRVAITFIDRGKPFDPLTSKEPDFTKPVKERGIGGMGLFMVKKTMDDVSYCFRDGQNILTIRKKI